MGRAVVLLSVNKRAVDCAPAGDCREMPIKIKMEFTVAVGTRLMLDFLLLLSPLGCSVIVESNFSHNNHGRRLDTPRNQARLLQMQDRALPSLSQII